MSCIRCQKQAQPALQDVGISAEESAAAFILPVQDRCPDCGAWVGVGVGCHNPRCQPERVCHGCGVIARSLFCADCGQLKVQVGEVSRVEEADRVIGQMLAEVQAQYADTQWRTAIARVWSHAQDCLNQGNEPAAQEYAKMLRFSQFIKPPKQACAEFVADVIERMMGGDHQSLGRLPATRTTQPEAVWDRWDGEVSGGQRVYRAPQPTGAKTLMVQGTGREAFLAGGSDLYVVFSQVSLQALRDVYVQTSHLYLPGGRDIHPHLYKQRPHARLGMTNRRRDEQELQLARWALADGKPILGICRGHQVLCVAAGGDLYQDIPSQRRTHLNHRHKPHWIEVAPDSLLAEVMGVQAIWVNSFHHQAVKTVPHGWQAVAWSEDGVIEAMEPIQQKQGGEVISVQFHPERMTKQEPCRRLFRWFARVGKDCAE